MKEHITKSSARDGSKTTLPAGGSRGRFAMVAVGTAAVLALGIGFAYPSRAAPAAPKVSFQNEVLPIFQQKCISCHGAGGVGYISSSLDLRTYQSLRQGSTGGVAVIPFHADRSPMMRFLKGNWHSRDPNALKMPPLGPQLSPQELQVISNWIDEGAKDN